MEALGLPLSPRLSLQVDVQEVADDV